MLSQSTSCHPARRHNRWQRWCWGTWKGQTCHCENASLPPHNIQFEYSCTDISFKIFKKRIKSWKLTHLLSCRNGWVINGCYQDELLHNLFIELLKPNKTPNCKKKPGKIMFTQYFTWTLLFSNQLKVCD